MDFDVSKENIQPLRGGRNVTQLEVALQAAHNPEYQLELHNQREEFENAIRNYSGEDPLDNFYQYISWVEQSYPKHGHEGNLMPLLEDCLTKFENDKTYINDRRFCKLWIKYIDMQQNPIELYHMLYSRGICKGCAELYIAWAYYHELNADLTNADLVFKTGKKELAQPFSDLAAAHQDMLLAAGVQRINGVIDETRLTEQRQALTSLHTFRLGRVGSVRTVAAPTPGIHPSTASAHRPNVPLQIYTEHQEEDALGASAPPISVISAVKRDDAVKENLIKPGTWNKKGKKYAAGYGHKMANFAVHVDSAITPEIRGIYLPKNFSPISHEDFSLWKSDVSMPEVDDPTKIPMYCKKQVYIDPTTEYSIEEIRASRYLRRKQSRLSVPLMETEQAIQSIMGDDQMDLSMHDMQEIVYDVHPPHMQQAEAVDGNPNLLLPFEKNVQPVLLMEDSNQMTSLGKLEERLLQEPHPKEVMHLQHHDSHNISHSFKNLVESPLRSPQLFHTSHRFQENASFHSPLPQSSVANKVLPQNNSVFLTPTYPGQSCSTTVQYNHDMCDLWRSPEDSHHASPIPQKITSKFNVFEESAVMFQQVEDRNQPKGSAMKTPFKEITHEDLAETGSRGGLDAAATAQPADGAKRLPIISLDDDSSSRFGTAPSPPNTEIFYLNAMHVSTPSTKPVPLNPNNVEDIKSTKKQLFPTEEQGVLSVIMEEKSTLSSSSGASSAKSNTMIPKASAMDTIAEENPYQFNLAQNMKANAALREQLLNSMKSTGSMDCDTQPSTPTSEEPPVYDCNDDDDEEDDEIYEIDDDDLVPYTLLPQVPSDPFQPKVVEKQLQHVGFPGRHRQGYVVLQTAPRIALKKEPCVIGNERFLVEKLLGKGTFGSVYKAIRVKTGEALAVKVQRPPNRWEFYICRELQNRFGDDPIKQKFMSVHMGYFSDGMSVLLSDFSPYGSLLDIVNLSRTKLGRAIREPICLYLATEMLTIVQAMHKVKIIHADLKPDNFLVTLDSNNRLGLQLIDFGCSIDMSLYPEGSMFIRKVTTEDFVCCEMRDNRPWSYHTDLFCVAATAHVLLFDKYIQLQKCNDIWSVSSRLVRYWRRDVWNIFFNTLLNMQEGLPDLETLKQLMLGSIVVDKTSNDMRELINMVTNR